MDSDWRSRLHPESRGRIIIKIMETLSRHISGSVDINKIATRFEEKIYHSATTQTDYLRKISLKLLSMETKTPLAAPAILSDEIPYDANSGVSINHQATMTCPSNPNKRPNSPFINCQMHVAEKGESSAKRIKVSGQKLEPTFSCPICMHTMESLWSTICGHIFCEICIKFAIRKEKKCPICRNKLSMRNNVHKIFLPNAD